MRRASEWFSRPSVPPTSQSSAETLPGPDEQSFIRQLIQKTGSRLVLVDFATTLPALDRIPTEERARLQVAVLTHNLNSRRTRLYREHGVPLDFLPMTEEEETKLLERADIIVAIQEREAEAFRAMLPHKTVVTVPMPVLAAPLASEEAGDPVCLFVGGYSGHNLAGLAWLLREVWPLVLQACPEARLHVAGTVSEAVPDGTPGVSRLGSVASLRDAYAAARVALAPLPMGTGLKIKVIEAMGWGRPVVTTSAGAEGFAALERGDLAVVADDPESYATAVVRLLRSPDEWQRVVSRQLAWVEKYLAPATVISPLLGAWQERTSPNSSPSPKSTPAAASCLHLA